MRSEDLELEEIERKRDQKDKEKDSVNKFYDKVAGKQSSGKQIVIKQPTQTENIKLATSKASR